MVRIVDTVGQDIVSATLTVAVSAARVFAVQPVPAVRVEYPTNSLRCLVELVSGG